jgi:predicted component of viral defense system (DUF524 family)
MNSADVAIEVPDGINSGLHLLDAKFRMDRWQELLAEAEQPDGDAESELEEHRGTFKRVDLYKMRAYRDSILRARSVWILYSGSDFKFFAASSEPIDSSASMPGA